MTKSDIKTPRLFIYEETEGWWCPIEPNDFEGFIDLPSMDCDEIYTLQFKRVDMTDEEFKAIPEG